MTRRLPGRSMSTKTDPPMRRARFGPRAVGLLGATGAAVLATLLAGWMPASASSSPSLSGVSIVFGDQVDQYQTIVNATDTLKGAPYTVTWSNFIGGPPIIAAEVGGSVDLGDMAETPTVFAQAAGDAVKVIAVSQGVGSTSAYGIVVPSGSSI